MSFNRLMYDKGTQEKTQLESIAPGIYNVDTPVLCGQCFETNPMIRMQKTGVSLNTGVDWRFYGGPIDVESDLKNINRPASNCPKDKYEPKCPNCGCTNQGQPCGAGVIATCTKCKSNLRKIGQRCQDNNLIDFPDCYFPTEDTRLSNPPCTLRGTGWNRFDPLCKDPQKQVLFPGDFQIPTRIVIKDNHRPCVPTPSINNMKPVPRPQSCPKTKSVCGSFTSPLYQYDVC